MINRNMISEFQGEYRWLSNFTPVPIQLNGVTYRSVEHAYMSAKSDAPEWKMLCEREPSPGKIKRISRLTHLVSNWEDIKVAVMKECLVQKFNQEPFRNLLAKTGTRYIQEGNRWGDRFWGVDLKTGKGKNNLGHLIMEIRHDIHYENAIKDAAKNLSDAIDEEVLQTFLRGAK